MPVLTPTEQVVMIESSKAAGCNKKVYIKHVNTRTVS